MIETNSALSAETLVPIGKGGKLFPYPVGRTALERWMRHGVRGVRLESILIGNRRFTSEEAIQRFVERTNVVRDASGNPRRSPAELAVKKLELGLN